MYVECHHFNSLQYSQLCLEGSGLVFKTQLFELSVLTAPESIFMFSSPKRAQTVALASILSKDHPSFIIINRDVCVFLASRPYGAVKSESSAALGSTLIVKREAGGVTVACLQAAGTLPLHVEES